MNQKLVQPEPPDPLVEDTRAFWREVGKTLVRESVGTIDETAKQIIAVTGILEGLYFHAITFSELRGKVLDGWLLTIYLTPIIVLLMSLISALLVYFPDRYRVNIQSSAGSKETYEHVVTSKLRLLKIASFFMALGVFAVFLAVLVYLRG